tara:strand:+ start:757 stop:951 length:195 start_codon:yes stop_codon:yes gene_type:complete
LYGSGVLFGRAKKEEGVANPTFGGFCPEAFNDVIVESSLSERWHVINAWVKVVKIPDKVKFSRP